MRTLLLLASMAVTTTAQAQASSSPSMSPPSWAVRDPLSLPGDGLPPPMANVLSPSAPPNPNATPPALPTPPPGPALDLAIKAAQAALAKCKADGYNVGVAVSNSVGGMVIGLQADAALPGRVYNAVRKNLAALEFEAPTSAVREKLRAGNFETLKRAKPNMTLLAGAVPLLRDGKIIGAIGVSGAPGGERDEVCALAGAAVLTGKP